MTTVEGRNAPCSCGSGRKYKNCCEGKLSSRIRARAPWLYVGLALAAVAIVSVAFAMSRQSSRATPTTGDNTAGPPAAPWTYDPATNRHFDPGHNHWHEGPPPPAETRGTSSTSPVPPAAQTHTFNVNPIPGSSLPNAGSLPAPSAGSVPLPVAQTTPAPSAGATPAPWTYDAAKNQHWDPTHGHWHPGPPPEGSKAPK